MPFCLHFIFALRAPCRSLNSRWNAGSSVGCCVGSLVRYCRPLNEVYLYARSRHCNSSLQSKHLSASSPSKANNTYTIIQGQQFVSTTRTQPLTENMWKNCDISMYPDMGSGALGVFVLNLIRWRINTQIVRLVLFHHYLLHSYHINIYDGIIVFFFKKKKLKKLIMRITNKA